MEVEEIPHREAKTLSIEFETTSKTEAKNNLPDQAQETTLDLLPLAELKIRKTTNTDAAYKDSLNNLRAQITVVDNQLIEMLGKRMKVADQIGVLKKDKNVAVLQSKRWNEILGNMILEGSDKGLSEEFVLRMFKAIHQESINHQEKIING